MALLIPALFTIELILLVSTVIFEKYCFQYTYDLLGECIIELNHDKKLGIQHSIAFDTRLSQPDWLPTFMQGKSKLIFNKHIKAVFVQGDGLVVVLSLHRYFTLNLFVSQIL